MIFPQDVHKSVQNKNKMAGDNKTQLIITLFILGNFFGFIGLNLLISFLLPTAPLSLSIFIQLFILIVIGILCFRFLIFDENEKKREYKGQHSDSFAKYMYLRKDINKTVDVASNKVNVFEYTNGSAMCTIEFRFGSNDDVKAAGTKMVYEQLIKAISDYGFEYRFYVLPEKFSSSAEYKTHIDSINSIEDIHLRRSLMSVTDYVVNMSVQMSTVDVVYLMIRSVTNYQRSDLETLMRLVVNTLYDSVNAFRSITFLNISQLLEFYREFYTIEAIDLAMMKTIDMASDIEEDFSKIVQLYSLKELSGKVYKVHNDDSLFKIKEREI